MKNVKCLRMKLMAFTVSGKTEALKMEVSATGSHAAMQGCTRGRNTLSPRYFNFCFYKLKKKNSKRRNTYLKEFERNDEFGVDSNYSTNVSFL